MENSDEIEFLSQNEKTASTFAASECDQTLPDTTIYHTHESFVKEPYAPTLKKTRFLVESSKQSSGGGSGDDEPSALPNVRPTTATISNKFACAHVAYPDDPVEDPITHCCSPHNQRRMSYDLQARKLSINNPKDEPPSNFVSLKRYGYETKFTGPLLKLNVSGTPFIVKMSTVRSDPIVYEKLLETAEYLEETDEYYFERDPVVFRFVHAYLRYQELHLPLNICGPLLEKELEAWGLQLGFDLQRCCLGPVMDTKSKLESLKKFEDAFTESTSVHQLCCA